MRKVQRILATVAVVVAAGGVPLVTATSASASSRDCEGYVASAGYIVGPKVWAACGYKHLLVGANPLCITRLATIHVDAATAQRACEVA